jgi:fluoroacetyl-CoA thioesterase
MEGARWNRGPANCGNDGVRGCQFQSLHILIIDSNATGGKHSAHIPRGRRAARAPFLNYYFQDMAHHIPIGVVGEAEEIVELKHTLAAEHPELPPVYSTPDMIRLMEIASFQALQPFCEDGEITVGISIHVEHRAATGIGMRIHARAELESYDGRFYIMRVTADDGTQQIGSGTVGRAVVHVPTFLARMREKAREKK